MIKIKCIVFFDLHCISSSMRMDLSKAARQDVPNASLNSYHGREIGQLCYRELIWRTPGASSFSCFTVNLVYISPVSWRSDCGTVTWNIILVSTNAQLLLNETGGILLYFKHARV